MSQVARAASETLLRKLHIDTRQSTEQEREQEEDILVSRYQ